MKRFKTLLILLSAVTLLSSCFLFKPSHKVIEYDEEVKLHDGSMIWVHIKRHYGLVGEPFQKSGYLPSVVEISWDTGFEGVGRKSVYFTSIQIFDKYQGSFYVVGGTANQINSVSKESLNCREIGVEVLRRRCLVALNNEGKFFQAEPKIVKNFNNMNILYPEGIKNWGSVPKELEGKRLTWNEKISLQSQQPSNFQRIGKPFLTGE